MSYVYISEESQRPEKLSQPISTSTHSDDSFTSFSGPQNESTPQREHFETPSKFIKKVSNYEVLKQMFI